MTSFYTTQVLGSSLYLVGWLFVLYSVIGVVIESAFFLATERSLEARTGLLYLPLRPLYGVGGVAFTLLLHGVVRHPVLVFVLGALVATAVEYVASWLTETLFDAISWDYSDKRVNCQGRVCLQYSLCWGLLALVAMYLVDRPVRRLLLVPSPAGEVVLTVLLALVLLSAVLTAAALAHARHRVLALRDGRDADAAAVADQDGWRRLVARLAPDAVVINSFPRMTLVAELMERTGQQRAWIRLPARHPAGRPEPARARSSARS
jgi:uncharacterized membrane protein